MVSTGKGPAEDEASKSIHFYMRIDASKSPLSEKLAFWTEIVIYKPCKM